MDLNTFFDLKVCINLDRRPDRWRQMQDRLRQLSIAPVERFAALDGQRMTIPPWWRLSPGAYGCLHSHLAVIRMARERRTENLLILEDDAVFDLQLHHRFPQLVEDMPADWDMLLLGGWLGVYAPLTAHVARSIGASCTHAYALRDRIYDAVIELCERDDRAIDEYTVVLQHTYNCYRATPFLVWQQCQDSDVDADFTAGE